MGLVGMGRAFNLRFLPNGPLRTNCYHRPMPHVGFFGGGGNMSYTENISIQNGPTGFWGFMTGLTQGLFGGGMMGMGGCGLFDMIGMLKSNKTSQGPEQPMQNGEDKSLKNLIQVHGKDFEIVSHPTISGKYQAFPKNGGDMIEGDYDTVMKKCCDTKSEIKQSDDDKSKLEKEEPKLEKKEEPKLEKEEQKLKEDKSGTDPLDNKAKGATVKSGSGHSGVKVPDGWYRAPKGGDGKAMMANNSLRAGMSARQVTDIILNNKVNYLSPADRNKLAAEVEKYNPSIFKDGKVKEGADLNKLDIPSIDYIKNKYVNHDKMSTTSGTREARGTYRSSDGTSNTVGKTVTSTTGRYAKQINGKWHYFAQDGTELNETHVRKNDPDLWSKTH